MLASASFKRPQTLELRRPFLSRSPSPASHLSFLAPLFLDCFLASFLREALLRLKRTSFSNAPRLRSPVSCGGRPCRPCFKIDFRNARFRIRDSGSLLWWMEGPFLFLACSGASRWRERKEGEKGNCALVLSSVLCFLEALQCEQRVPRLGCGGNSWEGVLGEIDRLEQVRLSRFPDARVRLGFLSYRGETL